MFIRRNDACVQAVDDCAAERPSSRGCAGGHRWTRGEKRWLRKKEVCALEAEGGSENHTAWRREPASDSIVLSQRSHPVRTTIFLHSSCQETRAELGLACERGDEMARTRAE